MSLRKETNLVIVVLLPDTKTMHFEQLEILQKIVTALAFDNNQTLHDDVAFVSLKCAGPFSKIL